MRARLENQPKITPRGLPSESCEELFTLSLPEATRRRIWSSRGVSGRSRVPFSGPRGGLGPNPRADQGASSDPGSTQVASPGLLDRLSRPNIARKGRSTDQSRPKIARRGLRETILDDFQLIWGRFGCRFSRCFDAARRLAPPRADLEYTPPCASGLRCALCAHDAKINRKSLREAFPSEPCEE